ncbi:MAG: hypothetical protein QME66_05850 [Candidatus Eisenbacteria bacterium]|nr:hypothetical protein [Candidatus Eisenbacteria bacterium]
MKGKRKYTKKSAFWNNNGVLVDPVADKTVKKIGTGDICSVISAEVLIGLCDKNEKTITLPSKAVVIRKYLADKLVNTQFLGDISKELDIKDEEVISAISN